MDTTSVRMPLSRQRVLSAAMDLADAEGVSAITMRRLAADLGVEAMSLYYHVPGKEGLLDGLAEAVLDEINAAVTARVRPDDSWPDSTAPPLSRRARGDGPPPLGAGLCSAHARASLRACTPTTRRSSRQ